MGAKKDCGVSYTRFSDGAKQSKGDSQDRQDRMFRDFCKRHNLTPLPEVFADRGRSGYRDEHRKKGRFGQLVAAAKDGRFEPGTVIVVEAWDRLGRLRPDKQTELIAELLRTGVKIGICRLDDVFTEDDFGTHKWTTLAVFVQLAYQESKQKADRIKETWVKRRERARSPERRPMSRRLPAWVKVVDGQMVPIPERVATLQKIFRLSADGYGGARLVKALADPDAGSPPFGGKKWTVPYVRKILNDRRVLGECQPRDTDGKPEGPVIPDYYPRVISEEEYLLARAGQAGRKGNGGRGAKPQYRDRKHVNVFRSLLTHARDGEGFFLHESIADGKSRMTLATTAGMNGRSKHTYTFPYLVFEDAVLGLLREVNPGDVLPPEKEERGREDVLRARLKAVRDDLAGLKEDLQGGYSKTLASVVREKELEEEKVAAELQEELARSIKPAARAWKEVPGLVDLIRSADDPDAVRLRLRAVLERVVRSAFVLLVRRGSYLLAAVQFYFEGDARRDFLIVYQSPGYNRAGGWWALSLAEAGVPGSFDLRRREDVRELVDLLSLAGLRPPADGPGLRVE